MTYTEYVQNYIKQQDQGVPIYTDDVAEAIAEKYGIDKKKASAAAAVAVKRIMDKGNLTDLRCYQKGIYYRTTVTPFGEMGISREKLIADKYLLPENRAAAASSHGADDTDADRTPACDERRKGVCTV